MTTKTDLRLRLLKKKLRFMKDNSKQSEDQMKRINSIEDTGKISKRKKRER